MEIRGLKCIIFKTSSGILTPEIAVYTLYLNYNLVNTLYTYLNNIVQIFD